MICTQCKIDKDSSQFAWLNKSKNILHKKCKSCKIRYNKEYYKQNRDKYTKRNNEKKLAIKQFIYDYLTSHPCIDCGESRHAALDFDHVRGNKKFNISEAARKSCTLDSVEQEIAKCEIHCLLHISTYLLDIFQKLCAFNYLFLVAQRRIELRPSG